MTFARTFSIIVGSIVSLAAAAPAQDLADWFQSVNITPTPPQGIAAVTLAGVWNDTCIPDSISHTADGRQIELTVTYPGVDVACGDALTPWRLTEEIGPVPAGTNVITASLVAVDPTNRNIRKLRSGPDFVGRIKPIRAEFRGLGTGDVYESRAFNVSADGRVVVGINALAPGSAAFITNQAFAWTPETGQIDLGVLPGGIPGGSSALGVSADGNTVVGSSSSHDAGGEGFRWTLGSGMQGLGGLGGMSASVATAASQDGRVVVGSGFVGGNDGSPAGPRAFRWTDVGEFQDLGELYPEGFTNARDTSADGNTIVGQSGVGFLEDVVDEVIGQAFVWQPGTGIRGLGFLAPFATDDIEGTAVYESAARGVSASGEFVVGYSRTSIVGDLAPRPTTQDAFRWTEETGMVGLERLRSEEGLDVAMEAVDVSGDGETIVGMADFTLARPFAAADAPDAPNISDHREAFIWDAVRGTRSLRDVLMFDAGIAADTLAHWDLGEVTAISDDGTTVVGFGVNPQGQTEAWRAVMSHTFAPGDADFSGAVDFRDFLAMASSFGKAGQFWTTGDFDADGRSGFRDFLALAQNYDLPAVTTTYQVPEPTGWAAVVLGLIVFTVRRRDQSAALPCSGAR